MKKTIPWLAAALITLAACRKNLDKAPDSAPDGTAADVSFFKRDRPTPGTLARRTAAQPTFAHRGNAEYADEQEILLAPDPLPNPYTPQHMAAAHNLVYGTSLTEMPVTDLYVRFDPAADSQVAVLAEDLDLDLYEYPLDRELLQEGDYYVHPGKTAEDLQPLYTVVPAGFQFPAGIPHTVLSPLHLPPGGNVFLEELAESMAAGATYARSGGTGTDALLTRTDIPNGPGLRPPLCELTEDGPMGDCPNAGPPTPAPPVCGLPALQCGEAKRPRGRIRAWDTQKNQCLPLRGTQVVAKRWFKGVGTKIYTDAQGNWQSPQRFGGKVQVHTWFRNNTLSARPLRLNFGIRLSLLPVRHKQGTFQGCAMNTIDQIYYRHADRNTRSFLYWLAAHALNARAEQWDAAAQEGLKPFAGHRLVVYLQRGGEGYNRRAEPELLLQSYLYRKRGFGEWLFEAAKLAAYLAEENPAGAIVTYLNNILGGQRPDIVYRYNTLWENLSSSEVNQRFYAVYAQCGLLKAVEDGNGDVRWKRYFKAKAKDIDLGAGILGFAGKIVLKKIKAAKLERDGTYTSDNEQFNPTSLVTMVAGMLLQTYYSLSQPDREFYHQVLGFGEYFGHWLANERYGQLADPILNQKRERVTGDATGSSHKKYLEAWDPGEPLDEFKYGKEGLFHDLEDNTPNEIVPRSITIPDLVFGIKAKDYQTAIMGGDVYASPEGWKEVMENVKFRFPLQTNNIVDLYRAYNVW